MFTKVTYALSLCALMIALPVIAQENTAQDTDLTPDQQAAFKEDIEAWAGNASADTGANCFDYYTFQSVQVSVGPNANTYTENQLIEFTGTLHNQNPYPVVDGNVLVRINKKNPDYKTGGHFVIDEFYAAQNITITANGTKDISFSWHVPEGTPAGDYTVDYFFSVGKQFNLGGLPFTHDITIGGSSFTIDSDTTTFISFEPSQTTVNGEKYNHIGSAPIFEQGEEVTIQHTLTNTTDATQEVDVTHELYFWDSLRDTDKRDTQTETLTIPAHATQTVSYTIPAITDSVSFVKSTAVTGNHKSITWVRVGSNIAQPRLNYPGLTKFPLTKGDSATLFSCFHNTSGATAEGTVEVTLTDKDNKEVASLTYEGTIPGAMSAAKEDFTADKDYDYLTITAKLYDKAGTVLENYSATYDCKELGCSTATTKTTQDTDNAISGLAWAIIAALISALLIVGIVFAQKKKGA